MALLEKYVTTTGDTTDHADTWTAASDIGAPASLGVGLKYAAADDRVNIKAGVYDLSDDVAIMLAGGSAEPVNDGTQAAPIWWRGYSSVIGDATTPVVTLDADSEAYIGVTGSQDFHIWDNIKVINNITNTEGFKATGDCNWFHRCWAAGVAGDGFDLAGNGNAVIGCEVSGSGSGTGHFGVLLGAGTSNQVVGTYVHGGTGAGFRFNGTASGNIVGCISAGNATHGITVDGDSAVRTKIVSGTTCWGNTLSGIHLERAAAAYNMPLILNNVLIARVPTGQDGITTDRDGLIMLAGSAFDIVDGAAHQISSDIKVMEAVSRITLSGDPCRDGTGHDFRVKRGLAFQSGWPGQFLVNGALTTWSGVPSIGAVNSRLPRFHGLTGGSR